ncbi:MAG: hypothetical protein HY744_16660 [Deltaproteobacteria bacterium]|nr:hypothetical protein [Deltaproteobacteria bacterium]
MSPHQLLSALLAFPLFLGGCIGLHAGSRYPDYDSGEVRKLLWTPENDEGPSFTLGELKIRDEACKDVDTHAVTKPLTKDDFSRFLQGLGVKDEPVMARGNLYWYEFPGTDPEDGDRVRLRLAVRDSVEEAALDLHKSLLEHGPGWWGVRRSNLAILAPKAGVAEALAFAIKYKLVCWGTMAMAHVDDVYVVPGPYTQL